MWLFIPTGIILTALWCYFIFILVKPKKLAPLLVRVTFVALVFISILSLIIVKVYVDKDASDGQVTRQE